MSETLWQKAYDEYVQDNSYQGKLEKENKRLKAKLQKIEQIVNGTDDFIKRNADYRIAEIKEVLERE